MDRDPLQTIFRNLERWRHLPAYQLERRADIFFSAYLKGMVEEFTGTELEGQIIPELPVKRDIIWTDKPSNLSVKIDYTLFTKDRRHVYLVELKTDAASRRDTQDWMYQTICRAGLPRVLEGIKAIALASKARKKYYHLLASLAELGLLSLPPDLVDYLYPQTMPGLTKRLKQVKVLVESPGPMLEVIYLQPKETDGVWCIDFETFAEYVSRFDDPVSREFSGALRRWAATEAGAVRPFSPRLTPTPQTT